MSQSAIVRQPHAREYFFYGLMGWALGAVALPIYLQVPFIYSRDYEVPSAWVGAILLLSRLIDGILDPVIGLWLDRRTGRSNRYTLPLLLAVPLLLVGMFGVYFPIGSSPLGIAISLAVFLNIVHLGYSFAAIAYQSWGSELGANDHQRSSFVAMREGIGILGAVFAVSISIQTHPELNFSIFAVMLCVGISSLLILSPRPTGVAGASALSAASMTASITAQTAEAFSQRIKSLVQLLLTPMKHRNFRRLLVVFLVNGVAAALPATLVPFFMQDRLGLTPDDQWVLGVYFLTGASSTMFWVWLAGKLGLARCWMISMWLSIPAFVMVIMLNRGDLVGYLGVCILTGFCFGADLSLPAAIVARMIDSNGEKGRNEGSYFGLWNWVTKLNLALAPSFALSVLYWFDYTPDHASSPEFMALPLIQQLAQDPLIWVYALLPCVAKVAAILLLHWSGAMHTEIEAPTESRLANT